MADMYDDDMTDSSSSESKESESSEQTALLPKSFFPDKDLEVDKVCKIKVKRIFEDEVEVSYVRHDKDKDDDDDEDEEEMAAVIDDDDEAYV